MGLVKHMLKWNIKQIKKLLEKQRINSERNPSIKNSELTIKIEKKLKELENKLEIMEMTSN